MPSSTVIFAESLFFFRWFLPASDDDNGSIERSFSKEADCVIASRALRRLRPRIWSNARTGSRRDAARERQGEEIRSKYGKIEDTCSQRADKEKGDRRSFACC